MSRTQEQAILSHLKSGKTLTPLEALERYGCFRLGARIWDMKQAGYNIVTERETKGGKSYARYRMEGVQ